MSLPRKYYNAFKISSLNFFVINCGLVIALPTTTAQAPFSKASLAFSGVSKFPSAITSDLQSFIKASNTSKLFIPLECSVYPTKVVPT